MWQRIHQMLIKEFIQVLRDPRMRMVTFLMPLVQLLLFGYVATNDVRNVATAVCDRDHTVASRELLARFVHSGYFQVVARVDDPAAARAVLDHGTASALLHIHAGFENDLRTGRSVAVQLQVDGTDSNTARILLDYGSRIVQQLNLDLLTARMTRVAGIARLPGHVDLQTRAWFNENLESRNFFVPGVIAITVTLTALLLTSMAVVREKEIGTMEQLLVTPIAVWEFILGKTTPFAVICFVDVLLLTVAGVWWFDVPIRGSLGLLLVGVALYLLTTLSVGLLISTISQTQQQAMMSTFFFYMPAMLLSGFMFPVANMPVAIQWLTIINPLRYFLTIIRGIFLKGTGFDVLWPQLLALAIIGACVTWLVSRRFHKTLA